MEKKYNNDKITTEEWGLAAGCLVISFGLCSIFDLSGFLTGCIFVVLYIFLLSCLRNSKEKQQQKLLNKQMEIRKKYLEEQKRIQKELKEKENIKLVEEQEEIRKEFDPHPNQIALFDANDYQEKTNLEKKDKKLDNKLEPKKEEIEKVLQINKSKFYIFEYDNENEFRKLERSIKKYNMLAYKKLYFEFYPSLKDGKFLGNIVSVNKKDEIEKYELELPTLKMFSEVHGTLTLHYTVYKKEKIIVLNTITPKDILLEGHNNELMNYKGVMLSKSHTEKDKFKIDLLNMLNK